MQVLEAHYKKKTKWLDNFKKWVHEDKALPATPLMFNLPGNTVQLGERCGQRAVTAYHRYRSCHGSRLARKNGSPTTASILHPPKSSVVRESTGLSNTVMATPSMTPLSPFSFNSCDAEDNILEGRGRRVRR